VLVDVALAPRPTRQVAPRRRIGDDGAKELAFARVNANVLVADAFRIDETADDEAGAAKSMAGGTVTIDQSHHGSAAILLHRRYKARQLGTRSPLGREAIVVRLLRLRHGRIAEIESARVRDPGYGSRPGHEHCTCPSRFDRHAESGRGPRAHVTRL
jgi:hypothetical protein